MKPYLICSKSTRKDFPKLKKYLLVSNSPTKDFVKKYENTENNVIAVGGGSVIDTAKIISRNPIIAYPTTASGSALTSHAVYWDGSIKYSKKTHLPKVYINSKFLKGLPKKVIENTTYDALCHAYESLWSKNATKESDKYARKTIYMLRRKPSLQRLVEAGNYAGKAIEITGTNILHSLSYPMTGYFNISHGKALGYLLSKYNPKLIPSYLPKINIKKLDVAFIIKEALKYKKINNTKFHINESFLKKFLKN